jgi:hypothetical protein
MLGALHNTPFVDNIKIAFNSFSWGNNNYMIKSSPAPYFLVTLDDNLLITNRRYWALTRVRFL